MSKAIKLSRLIHTFVMDIESDIDEILRSSTMITGSQFFLMSCIEEEKSASQAHIATALKISEAAVSRHIKNLHGKGFVTSSKNMENLRTRNISLTHLGSETLDSAKLALKPFFDHLYSSIHPSHLDDLTKIFSHLIDQPTEK